VKNPGRFYLCFDFIKLNWNTRRKKEKKTFGFRYQKNNSQSMHMKDFKGIFEEFLNFRILNFFFCLLLFLNFFFFSIKSGCMPHMS